MGGASMYNLGNLCSYSNFARQLCDDTRSPGKLDGLCLYNTLTNVQTYQLPLWENISKPDHMVTRPF